MWHRADPLLPPRGSHTSPEGSALRVPGQHRTGGTAPIVPRLKKKKAILGQISGVTSCPEPSGQGHACGCSPRAPRQLSHLRISHHGVPSSSCHASPKKMGFIIRLNLRGVLGVSRMKAASVGAQKVKAAPRGAHLPPASGSLPRHLQFPRAGRMQGGTRTPAVLPVLSRTTKVKPR